MIRKNQVEEHPPHPARPSAAANGHCLLAFTLGAILLFLPACAEKSTPPSALKNKPNRIICASPAIAELVFSLGCGQHVVGVSAFTDWPPAAAQLPIVGDALTPNREKILALQPNLILAQGRAESLRTFAAAHHIPFNALPLETLADLRTMIQTWASTLGVPKNGAQLLEKMDADLRVLTAPTPIPVFIALQHRPGDLAGLMTAGPTTFLSEIVAQAGGSNIFADLTTPWPRISQETLIRRKPALILDFQNSPANETHRAALVTDWNKLGFQPHQIRILDDDTHLKPGLRAIHAAHKIAAALQSN